MLKCIANREIPIPDHMDIFFLDREVAGTDKSALATVLEVDKEKHRLEEEADRLVNLDMTPAVEQQLSDIYER